MIHLKHITVEKCETCGAEPTIEGAFTSGGLDHESSRAVESSRGTRNTPPGKSDYPCPRHPSVLRKRADRIRVIKTLLSTLTKLELPIDDAGYLAERIQTCFDIKDSDLR